MTINPLVSICIPTYNQTKILEKNLNSILLQSYLNYEVIISDDTRDDAVMRIVKKYESEFRGRLKYFKNLRKLGSPGNWNKAILESKGKYIKILHHDDWFSHSNSLKNFVKLMENNPNAVIGFTSSINFNIEKSSIININFPSNNLISNVNNNPISLIHGNIIGSPSATIYKRCKHELYFDTEFKWLVDVEFYYRLLTSGKKLLVYDDSCAVTIGISTNQITAECMHNEKIWVYETLLLYKKLNITKITNKSMKQNLFFILRKFNIKSISDLKNSGYSGALPSNLRYIIFERLLIDFYKTLKTNLLSTYVNFLGLNNRFFL